MFLRRDYRDRAIGLVAAYAVLIAGIVATGAIGPARAKEPAFAEVAAIHADPGTLADDCSSPLHDRSDTICYIC